MFLSDEQSRRLLEQLPNMPISLIGILFQSLSTPDHMTNLFHTNYTSSTIFWLIERYFSTCDDWAQAFSQAGLLAPIAIALSNDPDTFRCEIHWRIHCLSRLILYHAQCEMSIQGVINHPNLLKGVVMDFLYNKIF